jgi:hypothetical protein
VKSQDLDYSKNLIIRTIKIDYRDIACPSFRYGPKS